MKIRAIPDSEFLSMSNSDLGRKYQISRERARVIRKKRGLADPFKGGFKKEERLKLARENSGKTVKELSMILGVSPTATGQYLRRHGIPYTTEKSWAKGKPNHLRKYPYHEVDWDTIEFKELSEKWGISVAHARTVIWKQKKKRAGFTAQQ